MLEKIKDKAEAALCTQLSDSEKLQSAPTGFAPVKPDVKLFGGFGMAHLKMEGAPVHPDDVEGDMTPEQEARQLDAYTKAVNGPAKKKGGAK